MFLKHKDSNIFIYLLYNYFMNLEIYYFFFLIILSTDLYVQQTN